jgi:hypothetical protein
MMMADTGSCTMCGGQCADLKTDNANCGKCGTQCPMGASCVQGSCQCMSGTTRCGNACVDVKVDNMNCGKCGQTCGGPDAGAIMGGGSWQCTNGSCAIVCPQPKIECSGACVDTKSDNDNCGMCGNACASMTEQCVQGLCCKVGESVCNGACVNLQTDPMNCGMCGKQCSGNTPGCSMGMCAAYVDHGPMHTFVNMTTDHYITQGCCSAAPNCAVNDALNADYFCKHFYGNNCSVLPGYTKHTTPNPTYPKMHKRGGCTLNGTDIPNTMCDQGPCKIGNWSEITSGLNNLVCRCL